ncbi:3-dehydroquinate synthase [Streptomyces sp. NBC_01264]|uniref:3-dehydroquinate synthase n=1 Tax=Streptomyces sp. NBC_01264 TaxID=2903804 RepID=UPI002256CD12|nr:3-dehydroquinate synthase [Streptomyces sp. NBC_01264]MCX4783806.1 3-dehydroquinate synthase [Streptomyces sp. NBC_01264]
MSAPTLNTQTLNMPTSAGSTRIPVGGERPYEVVVGHGLTGETGRVLGAEPLRVAVVHSRTLLATARRIARELDHEGRIVFSLEVPEGEAAKDMTVVTGLWRALADAGFTRSDAVVAVGGGATTDLAGFAAAGWLRGVRLVLVPTTLLGMVDAAIGGKTAVNLPQGKNLVGAFHPPAGVLCDLDLLDTLPPADYVSGLAEVLKAGFIADPEILRLVEEDPAGAVRTRELVERAVRVKAEVVTEDFREDGRREHLNYGHTLGHAIERVAGYRVRHGHAVAAGMVFAAELARLDGRLSAADVERHRSLLGAAGLPTRHDGAWAPLRDAMGIDKKTRGNRLRFVVLDAIGRPALFTAPDEDLLRAAYERISR